MRGVEPTPAARRLVVARRLDARTLARGLLSALAADGSTVLVRAEQGPIDEGRLREIAGEERADLPG